MLQEYDVVTLVRAVHRVPVPVGTHGAILIAHDSDPAAYEVEFVDADGSSLGTYTVQKDDIELVKLS